MYQPFGTSEFDHSYKYLLLFPYAIITTLSFGMISLLINKHKKNWTVGSELIKIFFVLLLISISSYLYNFLFLPFSIYQTLHPSGQRGLWMY